MWHEARKQERKIRDLIVDYKKRAERRRDFYEKIVSFNVIITLSSILNFLNFNLCLFLQMKYVFL